MWFYKEGKEDPLFETALGIARDTRVLYLDEFQVTDIADAMVLRRAFGVLWKAGVILIVT